MVSNTSQFKSYKNTSQVVFKRRYFLNENDEPLSNGRDSLYENDLIEAKDTPTMQGEERQMAIIYKKKENQICNYQNRQFHCKHGTLGVFDHVPQITFQSKH